MTHHSAASFCYFSYTIVMADIELIGFNSHSVLFTVICKNRGSIKQLKKLSR